MDRLVKALPAHVERRRRQHADRAREHRRFVGQDVTEEVAGDNHVELLRRPDELHRGVVDVHVRELDIGILRRHSGDDFAPQDRGVEHVGLVDRAELLAAAARGLESDAGDAFDFAPRIQHRVEAFVLALRIGATSARLAEVDITCQLADDHQVEAGDDFALQRRRIGQLRIQHRRTQIREQTEVLADRENALLRTHRARQRVVTRTTDCAEQNGIGRFRDSLCRFGIGMLLRVVRDSTQIGGLAFDRDAFTAEDIEHLRCFGDDLGTDAVAGHHCDFHAARSGCVACVSRRAMAARNAAAIRTPGSCRRGAG